MGIKMLGETECTDVVIPNGTIQYVYTFTETYDREPRVMFECGLNEFDLVVTTTDVTINMAHSNGVEGHLHVFFQDDLFE
jgi:hypothetical protein